MRPTGEVVKIALGRLDVIVSRVAVRALLLSGVCAGSLASRAQPRDPEEERAMQRPWMYVTGQPVKGLRSLADVRQEIALGHSAFLWRSLKAKVDREMTQDPLCAAGRNRNFQLVATTANRIVDAALVALITDDRQYADAALAQIDALFDDQRWPEWQDQAHLEVGYQADLRHGQLARALGMAYDWLYGLMTEPERERFLVGLDRRAIRPFKAGVAAKDMWVDRRSNWQTCVMGGFGILGMALGPDHPDADWMVSLATPRMHAYLDVIAPEGEFNESVQYSGSTMYVVDYLLAQHYASGGQEGLDLFSRLGAFCRWTMYCTVPPGRVFGFGDPSPDMPPAVAHLSAVAAVLRDPLVQWFYRQYADVSLSTHRRRALELLFFDPSLESVAPDGRLPLGRAFQHQAKIVSSRSGWNPVMTESVVYAKAGKEDYHSHADWGQVCIDGFGERLIVDLGSPRGGYPKSHKERYYNYQQAGHNVILIGQNDTGGIPLLERRDGDILSAAFNDHMGAAWSMDLSPVYGEGKRVVRHVIHLLPRVAAVLDEVTLEAESAVRLRWHTCSVPVMSGGGGMLVRGRQAALSGWVQRLDGAADVAIGRHEYKAPYDRNRGGALYRQSRDPYVEVAVAPTSRCRLLSLFSVHQSGPDLPAWESHDAGGTIRTPEGVVTVSVTAGALEVVNRTADIMWTLPLAAEAAGKDPP